MVIKGKFVTFEQSLYIENNKYEMSNTNSRKEEKKSSKPQPEIIREVECFRSLVKN